MVEVVDRRPAVVSGRSMWSLQQQSAPPHFTTGSTVLSELLRRSGAGDEDAFADLYDATCSTMFGIAVSVMGDGPDAEAFTQAVYTKVWKCAAHFDVSRVTPHAWLMAILREQFACLAISSTMVGRRIEE